jgi:hypothetical protein
VCYFYTTPVLFLLLAQQGLIEAGYLVVSSNNDTTGKDSVQLYATPIVIYMRLTDHKLTSQCTHFASTLPRSLLCISHLSAFSFGHQTLGNPFSCFAKANVCYPHSHTPSPFFLVLMPLLCVCILQEIMAACQAPQKTAKVKFDGRNGTPTLDLPEHSFLTTIANEWGLIFQGEGTTEKYVNSNHTTVVQAFPLENQLHIYVRRSSKVFTLVLSSLTSRVLCMTNSCMVVSTSAKLIIILFPFEDDTITLQSTEVSVHAFPESNAACVHIYDKQGVKVERTRVYVWDAKSPVPFITCLEVDHEKKCIIDITPIVLGSGPGTGIAHIVGVLRRDNILCVFATSKDMQVLIYRLSLSSNTAGGILDIDFPAERDGDGDGASAAFPGILPPPWNPPKRKKLRGILTSSSDEEETAEHQLALSEKCPDYVPEPLSERTIIARAIRVHYPPRIPKKRIFPERRRGEAGVAKHVFADASCLSLIAVLYADMTLVVYRLSKEGVMDVLVSIERVLDVLQFTSGLLLFVQDAKLCCVSLSLDVGSVVSVIEEPIPFNESISQTRLVPTDHVAFLPQDHLDVFPAVPLRQGNSSSADHAKIATLSAQLEEEKQHHTSVIARYNARVIEMAKNVAINETRIAQQNITIDAANAELAALRKRCLSFMLDTKERFLEVNALADEMEALSTKCFEADVVPEADLAIFLANPHNIARLTSSNSVHALQYEGVAVDIDMLIALLMNGKLTAAELSLLQPLIGTMLTQLKESSAPAPNGKLPGTHKPPIVTQLEDDAKNEKIRSLKAMVKERNDKIAKLQKALGSRDVTQSAGVDEHAAIDAASEAAIADAAAAHAAALQQVEKAEEELRSLRDQNAALVAANARAQKDAESMQESLARTNASLAAADAERIAARKSLTSVEAEVKRVVTADKAGSGIVALVRTLVADFQAQQKDLAKVAPSIAAAVQAETERLTAQLGKTTAELTQRVAQTTQMQKSLDSIGASLARVVADKEKLTAEHAAIAAKLATAEDALAAFEWVDPLVAKMKQDIAGLKATNDALTAELAALKEQKGEEVPPPSGPPTDPEALAELHGRIRELEERNKALAVQNADLYNAHRVQLTHYEAKMRNIPQAPSISPPPYPQVQFYPGAPPPQMVHYQGEVGAMAVQIRTLTEHNTFLASQISTYKEQIITYKELIADLRAHAKAKGGD